MQKSIHSFDNVRIHYNRTSGNGPVLVFLHGAGGDLTIWKYQQEFFHMKGIATIAIDLRGHGKSDRPSSKHSYKIVAFSHDIQCVLDAEKVINPVLIGHSFGGMVLVNYHHHYPKNALAYCMVDTSYAGPKKIKSAFNQHNWLAHKLDWLMEKVTVKKTYMSHEAYEKYIGSSEISFGRMLSDIRSTSIKSWFFTYEQVAHFSAKKVLSTIWQPVLIIEGGNDTITDVSVAQTMSKIIKNAKLRIIPFENHIITINNPISVTETLYAYLQDMHFIEPH